MACGCVKAIKVKSPKVEQLQTFEFGYIYKELDGKIYFVETYACLPAHAANVEFAHRLYQS